ncbi:MAG: hypothetical protein IJ890_08040 [Clostridia bacterium]|nr:hypothetical protein [Clostridia bacterium]
MRDFLKILLAIVIIAIIGVLAFAGKYYLDDKKQTEANTQNQSNSVNTNQNKTEDNKTDENNKENTEEQPNDSQEKAKEEQKEEEKKQENNEENNLSDEDKAKELAQKEYGTSDGVYFRIEYNLGNGVYEVSVRDNQTTAEYAWYKVDVRSGSVKSGN